MYINNETADGLVSLIRKIVREEISKAQKNSNIDVETFRHCIVTKVSTVTNNNIPIVVSADVKDLGTGETIKSVPNKSGETLAVDDTVRIYESGGSYNNCYIGLKCS